MATIRRSTIAEYGGGASQCARAIEFHITPPTVEVPNARQASAAPAGAHKYSAALREGRRALAMSDRCRFLAEARHAPSAVLLSTRPRARVTNRACRGRSVQKK